MSGGVRLAAKLLSSSVVAQVAVLAATAWAATRMTPEQFLLFGLVTTGAALLASCNTWAGESRVTVVDTPRAAALVRGSSTVLLFVLAVMIGVAGAGAVAGASWWHGVLFVGVGAALTGFNQVTTAILLRAQQQRYLARYRLVQGLSNAGLIVAGILAHAAMEVGLVAAWLVSLALGSISVVGVVRHDLPRRLASRSDLRLMAREVRLQPVSNLLAASVGTLNLMALAVSGAHGVSGAWALASRFLVPVVNTAYSTLQPLYVGGISQRLRDGAPTAPFYRRWSLGLLGTAALFAVGAVVLVWFLMPLLGDSWSVARQVVLPAVLYFSSLWLCLPLSQTLVMADRVDWQFWWTVARFLLCGAPLAAMAWLGPERALMLWSAAAAATFVAQLWLNVAALRQKERHAGNP